MPRTKRRTVKRSSADMNMTSVNATMANQSKNMKEILSEFECEKQNIEDYFSDIFDNQRNLIENSFLMTKMNLGDLLHSNLYDTIFKQYPTKSNSGTKKTAERPSRPVTKATVTRTTRQKSMSSSTSKTNGSATVTKHRSATRHADDKPLSADTLDSRFKTPINRLPVPASATVTPKVNMHEPISMMRRPNQGEVALSMTGSPLMVSSVSRDDMATVSVPLANGNILSILPRAGATMDISFDEQTKNELLLLKGNIEGLLKMNRRGL
ncbi:borealin-like [Melanaphis sacchari]|uniref:Borealin n=1 Tax=Melanaphis sacchari TaxID=742174 RepID=A0A2H8TSC9_9HEMI|nr:borealin-like [Melanaphis sacchari]